MNYMSIEYTILDLKELLKYVDYLNYSKKEMKYIKKKIKKIIKKLEDDEKRWDVLDETKEI